MDTNQSVSSERYLWISLLANSFASSSNPCNFLNSHHGNWPSLWLSSKLPLDCQMRLKAFLNICTHQVLCCMWARWSNRLQRTRVEWKRRVSFFEAKPSIYAASFVSKTVHLLFPTWDGKIVLPSEEILECNLHWPGVWLFHIDHSRS